MPLPVVFVPMLAPFTLITFIHSNIYEESHGSNFYMALRLVDAGAYISLRSTKEKVGRQHKADQKKMPINIHDVQAARAKRATGNGALNNGSPARKFYRYLPLPLPYYLSNRTAPSVLCTRKVNSLQYVLLQHRFGGKCIVYGYL
jgi:hypothetical protein